MAELLAPGKQIRMLDGSKATVKRFLGGGGQGNVYLVDYGTETKVLKWYHVSMIQHLGKNAQNFYQNILNNVNYGVRNGKPSPEFVWPLAVSEWDDGTFGYVMDLVPDKYHEVSKFMLCKVRMRSFKTVIDAALHIITAFRALHNAGYAYLDLNDGNFFIDPDSGKVLICDNDNVVPNGETTGVLGKPRYMAPEIVMGTREKPVMPNNLSDRHSMAVILYIIFCLNHPLEGKRSLGDLVPEMQRRLYGSDALFMMDPDNQKNAPDPVVHKNSVAIWPCLPEYMQALFQRAFSQKALQNPNARPKELDWIKALVRFRSDIVSCSCGNEVFTKNGAPCRCEVCKKTIQVPYQLEFPGYSIPAIEGTRIYRCQLGTTDPTHALEPMAMVVAKKNAPGVLGLRHMGKFGWNAVTSKGDPKKVSPGDVIPLKSGIVVSMKADSGSSAMNVKIIENK